MPKIKRIDSARHMDGSSWIVGEVVSYSNKEIITEIKDMSSEFESGVHVQYDIHVNGKLYQSLVNMPVIVTYEAEEN